MLDELLDHHEDDELDVELNKGFKKSRGRWALPNYRFLISLKLLT